MPFQSEKQRRYLWANEPEIARDWTDTYGSRIKKNDGGITNTVTVPKHWQSAPDHPKTELAYITKPEKDLLVKKDLHNSLKDGPNVGPGGVMSLNGGWNEPGGFRSGSEMSSAETTGSFGPDLDPTPQSEGIRASHIIASGEKGKTPAEKAAVKKEKKAQKLNRQVRGIKPSGTMTQKVLFNLLNNNPKHALQYLSTMKASTKDEDQEMWSNLPQELKDLIGIDVADGTPYGNWEEHPELTYDQFSMLSQVPGYGQYLSDRGMPGVKHAGNVGNLGDRYVKYTGELDKYGKKIKATDKYGNTLYGYHDKPGGEGPIYYPGYVPGGSPVSGGGGTTATEVVEDTPSAFQESLTTSTSSPFDYYVGQDPTAANLAWGEKFGVDPRTMYRTSWAADGGRIGRAYGGIMDSSTGRRAYGFGSFFKKIGRAAKKVLKSPIGKAALIGGAGWMLGGGGNPFTAAGRGGFSMDALRNRFGIKQLLTKDGAGNAFDPWKLGIAGLSALPFFMGGEEEDDDPKFDYDAAKNQYRDELMRIKAGALAGTLDPNKFRYLGVKDGGRIGLSNGGDPLLREEYDKYVFEMKEMGLTPMSFEEFLAQARAGMYAGGQSTPSDYTMEDAMMTTTQDKLGGITDVMKQADLHRQGSVGQFYAAQGGRIGYEHGGRHLLSPSTWLSGGTQSETNPTVFGTQDSLLNRASIAQLKDAIKSYEALMHMGNLDEKQQTDYNLKIKQLEDLKQGAQGQAQGGRIGYDAGGQTGHPPITMGQVPQVPPQMPAPQAQRPHPMPAPQPNRMVGMNPMMNRPMMNPMGGRRMAQEGGLMDLGGMEKDYRNDGGFVPIGGEEKADDVPARLSKNEFVFTADAVRGAGDGDIDKGAEVMENIMKNLEQGGQISEETQGLSGAQEMFGVSERLGEVL